MRTEKHRREGRRFKKSRGFPLFAERRRGMVTIWGVVSVGMLLTLSALVVDGAMLYGAEADLQAAADSAALAAASGLTTSPADARSRAATYAAKNRAAGQPVQVLGSDVVMGKWDEDMRTFTPVTGEDEIYADSVRVTASLSEDHGNPLHSVFAQVFGDGESDVRASATAVYRPRDIVLVLDLSGSMSFDSQISHIPLLGQDAIEDNLYQIWTELGSHQYGSMGFDTVYLSSNYDSVVVSQLGLDHVPYPYPSGSWTDFVRYVRRDGTLANNGYRKMYGGLTFMNYLLATRYSASQTPDLWMTSEQPITAVKDAVDIFLDFLRDVATNDQVGLSVYTSSNGSALLEHGLTHDIELIRSLSRHRQAGHYDAYTNIGAGMQVARQELDTNGRSGTLKTMILLTDGQANKPYNTDYARQYVLDEAYAAADDGYPIMAISLGADADLGLLRDVASITEGVAFNIPGGQSVADYADDLREVFQHIASERPMRLVE
ncbi:MAG: VWA domain-containing protein [Phycisphaeraceae bacterium]|nr:MAG: VWA domain-containing protein [Phycisphaeraceae bacterium]